MGISVVADIVPLGILALHQPDVLVGIGADDEERGMHAVAAQNVEDLGGIQWIRTIVESQTQDLAGLPLGMRAAARFDYVVRRQLPVLLGIPACAIAPDFAAAIVRRLYDAHHIAIAVLVHRFFRRQHG